MNDKAILIGAAVIIGIILIANIVMLAIDVIKVQRSDDGNSDES